MAGRILGAEGAPLEFGNDARRAVGGIGRFVGGEVDAERRSQTGERLSQSARSAARSVPAAGGVAVGKVVRVLGGEGALADSAQAVQHGDGLRPAGRGETARQPLHVVLAAGEPFVVGRESPGGTPLSRFRAPDSGGDLLDQARGGGGVGGFERRAQIDVIALPQEANPVGCGVVVGAILPVGDVEGPDGKDARAGEAAAGFALEVFGEFPLAEFAFEIGGREAGEEDFRLLELAQDVVEPAVAGVKGVDVEEDEEVAAGGGPVGGGQTADELRDAAGSVVRAGVGEEEMVGVGTHRVTATTWHA